MKYLKLIIIILVFSVSISCSDSPGSDKIVSLGSPVYNELSNEDIKQMSVQYNHIQEELNNIILNMSDNDSETIEKLNMLSEKSLALKLSMKNISPDALKRIYLGISKNTVSDEIINKMQSRYSNDTEFKKAYDKFVKSITL